MSSNKGKGTTSQGSTRKAAVPAAKPSMKQKTLLDSFFINQAPRAVPNEAAPMTADTLPSIKEELPMGTTAPTLADDVPLGLEAILVDELNTKQDQVPDVPSTEYIVVDNENTVINIDLPKDEVSERARSPSIVIIDEMKNVATASTTVIRPSQSTSRRAFKQDGRTPNQPIVIDSSPIKAPSTSITSAKPIHPFFVAKPRDATPSLPLQSRKKATQEVQQLPSFPDRTSQHIRGLQTSISGPLPIFPRRSISSKEISEPTDYLFLKRNGISERSTSSVTYDTVQTVNEASTSNIPQEHRMNHAAIDRILNYNIDEAFASRRPWPEKWRPTCAQEVLGNEKSALYLRNWLQALELQLEDTALPSNGHAQDNVQSKSKLLKRGLKRARVVRAVDRKRKRSRIDSDEEDDWIVQTEDESENEHVTYEAMDDLDDLFFEQPSSPSSSVAPDTLHPSVAGSQKDDKVPDLGQLHNTILLVGPHGSGKTASVYACAEELGWDVFEVYPGIGRRNGANVDNLVGEVGKNHLVVQNRQPADALKSFLRQKSTPEVPNSTPSAEDLRSGYSPRKPSTLKTPCVEPVKSTIMPVRQSLILLEEVDILFKEDSNFWPTVSRIIKECKRPVICTCNDISLVPLEELPLQSILYYEVCPPTIAASYLQGLCAAEGHLIDRKLISRLYQAPFLGQQWTSPFLPDPAPKQDLRRVINALQVLCTTANSTLYQSTRSSPSGNISAQNGIFLASAQSHPNKSCLSLKRSDTLSYLDGPLHLDPEWNAVITEFASYSPSDDDEVGHTILYDLYAQDAAQFGKYDRHEDMLTTATRLLEEMSDVDVKKDALTIQAFEENSRRLRREHKLVLREVCPLAVWTRQDIALDYVPLVRQMVAADDAQEAEEMGKKREGGRRTRNSARSGYVRMIGMSEEGRRVLESSVLGG